MRSRRFSPLTVLSLLILIVVYFSAAGRMKPRTNKIIRIIVGILLLILMVLAMMSFGLSYKSSFQEDFEVADAIALGIVLGIPVVSVSTSLFISSEKE